MADKKDEKKGDDGWGSPEIRGLAWALGAILVFSLLLTKWDGKVVDLSPHPIEDEETGRVVAIDEGFNYPAGEIQIGDKVILIDDAFVRNAPAQAPLGKQKKYEIATVQEGPFTAYDQLWWRLNFEDAPDGWVAEYSMTNHVTSYRSLHILPIIWKFIKPILWVLTIILLILYWAAKLRLASLRAEAEEKLKAPKREDKHIIHQHIVVGEDEQKEMFTAGDRRSNERWMHIVQLLQSHNQNDWRQAIIEADIILEEMLEKMGYDGMTIGDKLKNVEPSDFRTINQAWEAHKVRNRIAHTGSEFQISHREAERVINLYQEVFEEFYYI